MARDLEQEARNQALVVEAFDALFNRKDFEAAERYWSPDYVQHSAGIGQGRDGLFALVRSVHRHYETALAAGREVILFDNARVAQNPSPAIFA